MKKYVIAVDLGGTNVKIAVVKDWKEIRGKTSITTGSFANKGALIDGIVDAISSLIKGCGLTKRQIIGIGVGAPGLIDSARGVIHNLVNIQGFNDVPLKRIMEKKTAIKTYLDNDVNVMTLGELYYGAGRGVKNMVCITLGTGVGGGIVADGKLYRGSTLSAGEIGHMPLNEKGPRCNCGGMACMEKSVGNQYITRLALRKIRGGRRTAIMDMVNGDVAKITPEVISRAAQRGDALARSIWAEVGSHLGVTLAGVVNLLNPERIVIGGGVAGAGQFLFDAVRATVRKRAMKVPADRVRIVKAKLGQDAGLIGAAVLVRLAQ